MRVVYYADSEDDATWLAKHVAYNKANGKVANICNLYSINCNGMLCDACPANKAIDVSDAKFVYTPDRKPEPEQPSPQIPDNVEFGILMKSKAAAEFIAKHIESVGLCEIVDCSRITCAECPLNESRNKLIPIENIHFSRGLPTPQPEKAPEQKVITRRAIGEYYWFIINDKGGRRFVGKTKDDRRPYDDLNYERGNYYLSEAEANRVLSEM